jgi:hypothetical protein
MPGITLVPPRVHQFVAGSVFYLQEFDPPFLATHVGQNLNMLQLLNLIAIDQ